VRLMPLSLVIAGFGPAIQAGDRVGMMKPGSPSLGISLRPGDDGKAGLRA
jgi:hypothetical protein